jgi:uncharacterized protein with HEPN domain
MKSEQVYLIHIRECIERIERYTREGKESFFENTMIQDAVLRNLQVLAESTTHLSKEFLGGFSEVDWRAVAAFRNVLVHDYLGLDTNEIWDVVERDIPVLKRIFTPKDR